MKKLSAGIIAAAIAFTTMSATAQEKPQRMPAGHCAKEKEMQCNMEMKMGDMKDHMATMQVMMKTCETGTKGCAMDKMMADMKSMHDMMGTMMKNMGSMQQGSDGKTDKPADHSEHKPDAAK